MKTVTRDEFESHPAALSREAALEPVGIEDQGRLELVLLSAEDYLNLRGRDRKVYTLDTLPDDILEEMVRQLTEYVEDESNPP